MPTAHNDGVELAYELDGPADAEPVVLIEGLGYGRWMWHWQRERLADDYRLLLYDNRGTGASDAPEGPYTMAQLGADLEAVLADAGIEGAHLVGASMGGMIAMTHALEYDRAATLTLLCTAPGGEAQVPMPAETRERIFAVPDGADERETIRHRMAPALSPDFPEQHPDLIERIVDWRLDQDAPEHGRNAQAAAVQGFDASDRLGQIEEPTLIVHGDADRVLPVGNAEVLAERLPNAELATIEDGPHLVFVERPDAVAERIRAFLEANPIGTDSGGD